MAFHVPFVFRDLLFRLRCLGMAFAGIKDEQRETCGRGSGSVEQLGSRRVRLQIDAGVLIEARAALGFSWWELFVMRPLLLSV